MGSSFRKTLYTTPCDTGTETMEPMQNLYCEPSITISAKLLWERFFILNTYLHILKEKFGESAKSDIVKYSLNPITTDTDNIQQEHEYADISYENSLAKKFKEVFPQDCESEFLDNLSDIEDAHARNESSEVNTELKARTAVRALGLRENIEFPEETGENANYFQEVESKNEDLNKSIDDSSWKEFVMQLDDLKVTSNLHQLDCVPNSIKKQATLIYKVDAVMIQLKEIEGLDNFKKKTESVDASEDWNIFDDFNDRIEFLHKMRKAMDGLYNDIVKYRNEADGECHLVIRKKFLMIQYYIDNTFADKLVEDDFSDLEVKKSILAYNDCYEKFSVTVKVIYSWSMYKHRSDSQYKALEWFLIHLLVQTRRVRTFGIFEIKNKRDVLIIRLNECLEVLYHEKSLIFEEQLSGMNEVLQNYFKIKGGWRPSYQNNRSTRREKRFVKKLENIISK